MRRRKLFRRRSEQGEQKKCEGGGGEFRKEIWGSSTGVKGRGKINRLKKQTDLSFSFRENKLSIPFHEGQKRSRDEEGQGEVGARLRPTPQRDGQVAQAGQGPMRRPEEEEGRDSVSVRYDQTEES